MKSKNAYSIKEREVWIFAIIILLVILDSILTRYGIKNGLGHEVNPFLINIVCTDSFFLLKPVLIALTLIVVYKISRILNSRYLTLFASMELIILYALVCINNLMVLWLGLDLNLSVLRLLLLTMTLLALIYLSVRVWEALCPSPSSH